MSLDRVLDLLGLLGVSAVLLLALRGRVFRIAPVFCYFLFWCLLTDILYFVLSRYSSFSRVYFRVYLIQMLLDSIFQFAVLVELGWAVLRPVRSSLPRHSFLFIAVFFAIAGGLIWPIAAHMLPGGDLSKSGILFVHAQQTVAVLRVVIFIAMAGFSQMLSIGWRDRELQIATGLGFYSMCSLAILMIHTHQTVNATNSFYHVLDQIGVGSYLCSLLYWIFSFAQQEEKRQEFTPQMRNFLLAMSGGGRGPHRQV